MSVGYQDGGGVPMPPPVVTRSLDQFLYFPASVGTHAAVDEADCYIDTSVDGSKTQAAYSPVFQPLNGGKL